MFSGIRYILGYTDDESPAAGEAAGSDVGSGQQVSSVSQQPGEVETLVSVSTAALEKTLNAATTKFTEQLLPQQASIEQLQSSSHQLLPSITEQHEENESKKQAKVDKGIEAIELEASGFATVDKDDDDDDDCLEADSWELLDLVDRAEAIDQSKTTPEVRKDVVSPSVGLNRSTSGILKSTSGSSISNSVCQQQSRQKPKVSFETPDLVSSKQEIEQNKPKEEDEAKASSLPKKGRSKRNKRNAAASGDETRAVKQVVPIVAEDDKLVPIRVCAVTKSDKKQLGEANPSVHLKGTRKLIKKLKKLDPFAPVAPVSTLNYAKALSTKSKSEVAQKVSESETEVIAQQPLMETTMKKKKQERDTSKLEDGNEMMEQHFPALSQEQSSGSDRYNGGWKSAQESESNLNSADADVDIDAVSLTSSGFSDCDFGFGGVSDYVMRPKKANTKRNRTQSGSSSSFRAPKVGRGHSTKHAGANNRQPPASSNDDPKNSSSKAVNDVVKASSSAQAVAANKNSKPKRKRLESTSVSSKTFAEASSRDFLKPTSEAKLKQAKKQTADNLDPKSATKQSPASSSNDSSEIPEMDESWYVTPPPCFTGASKQNAVNKGDQQQPKAKEAARENALIEHPSIYIASSSKSILMERAALNAEAASSSKSTMKKPDTRVTTRVESGIPQKALMSKLEDAAWQSDDDDDVAAFDDDQFICSKPITRSMAKVQVQPTPAKPIEVGVESKPKVVKRTKAGGMKRVSSSSSSLADKSDKTKVSTVSVKPIEKRAWKNKFIVDDWDLDEQENVDSDFDSMFEPVKKRKTKAKRQQQQQQRSKNAQRVSRNLPLDVTTDSDDLSQETLEVVIDGKSGNSVELISIRSLSMENSMENANDAMNLFEAPSEEVAKPAVVEDVPRDAEKRRQPTQVKRIEPERRPGWQLKKQRSKRRPLSSSNVDNKHQSIGVKSSKRCSSSTTQSSASGSKSSSPTTSVSSSSRSSPATFMDRIGSSIVANLTNLTNGLVSSGALNTCTPVGHSSPLVEGAERMQQQAVVSRATTAVVNLGARKQLSRSSLKRQNVTSVQANMQRRPDRRLKMFAHPNGSSVNRKVHASIH